MHIGWVKDNSGDGYHAQTTVLVKPNGEPNAAPADGAGTTVSSASREDTVVSAGCVATRHVRAGNGHVPSMTANVVPSVLGSRSHVVRDRPSIKTCAPGRLWREQGFRHLPEAPPVASEAEHPIRTCACAHPDESRH